MMKQNTWTIILSAIAFCMMGLLVGCADAISDNPDDVDEVAEEADGDSDDGNTPISFTRIDVETDGDGDGTGGDGDGTGGDGDGTGGDGDGTGGDGDGTGGDGDGTGGDGDGTGGEDDEVSCLEYSDLNDGDLVDPLPQGFWKNNPEEWPYETDSDYAYLCGVSFMDVLWTPADPGNAWTILSYQYAAAVLNVESGVEACGLEELLAEAQELLLLCEIDEENRERALEISGLLDGFNNGEGDPGCCE